MGYIVTRKEGEKVEYLERFKAREEIWTESLVGCHTFPTAQAAMIMCDVISKDKNKEYGVEKI